MSRQPYLDPKALAMTASPKIWKQEPRRSAVVQGGIAQTALLPYNTRTEDRSCHVSTSASETSLTYDAHGAPCYPATLLSVRRSHASPKEGPETEKRSNRTPHKRALISFRQCYKAPHATEIPRPSRRRQPLTLCSVDIADRCISSLSRQDARIHIAHAVAFGLPTIAALQGVSGAVGIPVIGAVRSPVLAASYEIGSRVPVHLDPRLSF